MKLNLLTKYILVLIISLFILPTAVFGQKNGTNTNEVLPKNETINHDYFSKGSTVDLEGIVNGDAYVAGGNVTVDGTINGDLLAVGGNITISGKVSGNIRAAGGNITVVGPVERNMTLLGGTITVTNSSSSTGSIVAAGGNISILGPIGKEANLTGGQITVGNKIGGDLNATTGQLTLNPNASINGNLNYWSNTHASIASGATISGTTIQHAPPQVQAQPTAIANTLRTIFALGLIFSFIVDAILGIAFILLSPIFFMQTIDIIRSKPWISLLIGFLTLILFPILFILLLITIIGIPIALLLGISLAIFVYFARIVVAFTIGKLLANAFHWNISSVWIYIIGLVIYTILAFIPILNFFVTIVATILGLGALLIATKNSYMQLRSKNML